MDLLQAMEERHSVRAYSDDKIEGETLAALQNKIKELNAESGLNIQLALNEEIVPVLSIISKSVM